MNSYWIDSTKNNATFEKLAQDIACDVCIIGAGLFGLTTAYYLAKKGLKVVIIDKQEVGTHTSGHTTAKITSQHGLIYDYLIQSYNTNFAQKYLNANQEAIANIKNIIDSENIECDFKYENNYVYTTNEQDIEKIKAEVAAMHSLNFDAEFVTKTELPFNTLGAIKFKNQAQFHPRKYMLGLCNSILQNDGQIFTNSTITDVKKDGNYYYSYTHSNKIKSKYVVLASHYPFLKVPGFYFAKMYQVISYVIAIDPKTKLFNGMYISTETPPFSYRTVATPDKELLLVGGYSHKTGEKIDTTFIYNKLEEEAKKYYPDCEILYRWNTQDCVTLDKIPYIGEYSNLMPNMYIGTGFNKWGMTSSNVAANIVTDKILGIENKYEEVFTSTRLQPVKNRWEVRNMIKDTTEGLITDKFKIPTDTLDSIEKDTGKILEINGHKIGVYKDTSGNIFAVNPICTHLGCILNWNNLDKTWDCPCHGSRFNYMGTNIFDPAINGLEIYNL